MSWYYLFVVFAPAAFTLWFVYMKDKWEPEPKLQILKIFLIGIVSIPPTFLIEYLLQKKVFGIDLALMEISFTLSAVICFLVLAPIEEFFKYSVVKVFIYPKEQFDEPMDGVVYMAAAAVGFSAITNVMYLVQNPDNTSIVGILRGILATPAHVIFSGFIGVQLGKAKFTASYLQAGSRIVKGFVIAILLHGLYNTLIFSKILTFAAIPLLVVAGYFLLRQINQLNEVSPFKK